MTPTASVPVFSAPDQQAIIRPLRVEWVDYAKGIGIFLVVLGHVAGGLQNSPSFVHSDFYAAVLRAIYYFHMHLFFFLSGLFVRRSARRTFPQFVGEKLSTVAYPYVVWSVLQGAMQVLGAKYVNKPLAWEDLLKIVYAPIDQFWFLYALFVLFMIYRALYQMALPALLFFALSVGCYVIDVSSHDFIAWDVIQSVCAFALYFALGVVLEETGLLARLTALSPAYLLPGALAGYACVGVVSWLHLSWDPAIHPVIATCGIFATVALAVVMSRAVRVWAFVRVWGNYSLEIYLAHTIAAATCRIVSVKLFGYSGPAGNLILGTTAGLYLPVMLAHWAPRLGLPHLFTIGRTPVRSDVAVPAGT